MERLTARQTIELRLARKLGPLAELRPDERQGLYRLALMLNKHCKVVGTTPLKPPKDDDSTA